MSPDILFRIANLTALIGWAALILGIVSVTVCAFVGWIPGIIAIVLGRRSRKAIEADPVRLDGHGLATAGFVLGICGTALGLLIDGIYALAIVAVQQVLFPSVGSDGRFLWGLVLQGLTLGLLTALVALGMALVYRANRIINFAQAQLGAAALGDVGGQQHAAGDRAGRGRSCRGRPAPRLS